MNYVINFALNILVWKILTFADWSASNDCGPCVTAGFDGQIRISTLLSQWYIYKKKRLENISL